MMDRQKNRIEELMDGTLCGKVEEHGLIDELLDYYVY